jgi:hypothetical protein
MSYAAEAKGHCIGANACKGHGAGGHNACKGKGFLVMTKEECDKIPGTTFKSASR